MIYGSWNIRCDRQNFLSFWVIFCPFNPLTTRKIKILKLRKNTRRYYHFTHLHHKWQSYDVWFLRYGVQQTEFFVILDRFLSSPAPHPYGPRRSKFWKYEKSTWRCYHFTNVYLKWQSYDVSLLRHGVQQTECFVILDCFMPFKPPNNWKNQNFEKTPGDIIILYMCTINDNHMMYGSWDMECDRQNFLSFLGFELTFQSCIVKNSYKISLVLVLPECPPWFSLRVRKCRNFVYYRLLENAFSNLN